MNEMDFPKMKYFLECYFNPSAEYSQLESLVREFKLSETAENWTAFKNEIIVITQKNDFESIRNYVRKHGMRTMDDARIQWFLGILKVNI